MSNLKSLAKVNRTSSIDSHTKGTPVKITKGSLKGCTGIISGCTNDGIYFICQDENSPETKYISRPIGLFLPNEFEVLN